MMKGHLNRNYPQQWVLACCGLIAFFTFLPQALQSQSVAPSSSPEIRRALPLSSPTPPPFEGKNSSEDIRIAPLSSNDPQKAKEAQFTVAEGFYERKEYDLAILEYQKFLSLTSPGEHHRDQALFHMGESFRLLNKGFEAQSLYQQLLKEIPSGDTAASAAYRLGDYYHSRKELTEAIASFSRAASLTTQVRIQNAARYQEGLCQEELGDQNKAASLFSEIAQTTDNPITRYHALMLLATADEKKGLPEKARLSYLIISGEAPQQVAAEALVKAAIIDTHLGNKKEALLLFEKAADLKEGGSWGTIAALGSMKLAYEEKDYKKVIQRSSQALASSNLEERSQALLLTAQTERQNGNFKKSLLLYDQLIKEFPGSETAHEGSFARLLLLQKLKDPSLLAQIEEFVLATADPHQKAQAELLKGEVLFEQGNYAAAVQSYTTIATSDLSSSLKANALYKEAWSQQQLKDIPASITAYTSFLTAYPQLPEAADALLQRGLLEQQKGDLVAALADYSTFLEKYPEAAQRELVLQQKALTQGQQQDNNGMVITFQQLLSSYPKSKAAAQANYWIGWASFEAKNYSEAIASLEKAKQLDAREFGEKASIRLLLCYYYLGKPLEAARITATLKATSIPKEVCKWLGLQAYERGDTAQAASFLTLLFTQGDPNLITLEVTTTLARSLMREGKFNEAEKPAAKSLELSNTPATRATAILTLAKIQQGLKNNTKAEALAKEALLLQPEGNLNMEARLLLGDLLLAQQDNEGAARAYMAVALLTEDASLAPKALRKAAEAYQRAGNTLESDKALQELKRRFP